MWLVNRWSKNIYMSAIQTIETPITTCGPVYWIATEHPNAHSTLKYTNQPTRWNPQTPWATDSPKPPSPGKHSDRSVHWNTLIKSIETCNAPSPLKHPSVAPPFRILFNETNYINKKKKKKKRTKTTTTHAKKQHKNWMGFNGALSPTLPSQTYTLLPPSFLPFLPCNI